QPATIARYRQCLKTYQEWLGADEISSDSAKEFIDYLRQQGFKPSTVRLYYHVLKPFLSHLGIPLRVKLKKERRLPTYHGPDEVRAMLETIQSRKDRWSKLKERDRLIVLVLAYTGIRRGELLSLRLRDINFHDRMMRIRGKGDRERVIPIAGALYTPLRNYTRDMQPGDHLFPLRPKRIWEIITRYAKLAGIEDVHPHSFRHYVATQLVGRGVSIDKVQQLLGHADIASTAIYFDVLPQHLNSAVSALPKVS
ncbi:unnamed protein product, partial [marine sediment metagenome]